MAITWPFGKPSSQPSTSNTPSQTGAAAVDPMNDGAASSAGYDSLSPSYGVHHGYQNGGSARDRDTSALLRRQLSYEPESDADERSRLLPARAGPRPGVRGPLDPDDPAVTPYNLWTVGPTFLFIVQFCFALISFCIIDE